MAELTYTGRGGSRGAAPQSGAPSPQPAQHPQQHQAQAATRTQRPSTASPRLEGNHPRAAAPPHYGSPPQQQQQQVPSAQRMLAFLDSAERAAAKQPIQPPTFPPSGELASPPPPPQHRHSRPKSAAAAAGAAPSPLRASIGPRVMSGGSRASNNRGGGGPAAAAAANNNNKTPRRYGRVSLYDHSAAGRAPHEVLGPVILRDLSPRRVGFPARPPEDFLRAGEGLSLRQRNQLKQKLTRHPVNTEAPFQPGTGGVRLAPSPPGRSSSSAAAAARPLDWGSSSSSSPSQPATLLRTYYDNSTLDFVAVRWRGSRADALVWARGVTRGPETGGPLTRSYVSWAPEPPAELDIASWLPIFIDGVREYDEPYRFIAIRGSEEMLMKAGDTLHSLATSLVAPLRAVLTTREPTSVAVALQLMALAVSIDPGVAEAWAPAYGQFAQVLNLFLLSRGGSLLVDMGYNTRALASCRRLADDFLTAFQAAGGAAAVAAVRRHSPGVPPPVTDASQARAAAAAAAKQAEAGRPVEPGGFKPFTLF